MISSSISGAHHSKSEYRSFQFLTAGGDRELKSGTVLLASALFMLIGWDRGTELCENGRSQISRGIESRVRASLTNKHSERPSLSEQ